MSRQRSRTRLKRASPGARRTNRCATINCVSFGPSLCRSGFRVPWPVSSSARRSSPGSWVGPAPWHTRSGLVAMGFVAYAFVIFSRSFNSAGSVYAFNGAALGPTYGFVSAWILLLVYVSFAGGVYASTADIAQTLFSSWGVHIGWVWFALVGFALTMVFAYRSIRLVDDRHLRLRGCCGRPPRHRRGGGACQRWVPPSRFVGLPVPAARDRTWGPRPRRRQCVQRVQWVRGRSNTWRGVEAIDTHDPAAIAWSWSAPPPSTSFSRGSPTTHIQLGRIGGLAGPVRSARTGDVGSAMGRRSTSPESSVRSAHNWHASMRPTGWCSLWVVSGRRGVPGRSFLTRTHRRFGSPIGALDGNRNDESCDAIGFQLRGDSHPALTIIWNSVRTSSSWPTS